MDDFFYIRVCAENLKLFNGDFCAISFFMWVIVYLYIKLVFVN